MKSQNKTVAEILLSEIYNLGIDYVFLVPGAQIIPLLLKLYDKNTSGFPKPIIANHELAAGLMALGYARASGKVGVAFSIGGPGASYMVGAGVTAKADKTPVMFVTGNIPPHNYGRGEFQDASHLGTNDSAIYKEALGTSVICNHPNDISMVLSALRLCQSEMKPIHVQIPISVQKSVCKSIPDLSKEITTNGNAVLPEISFEGKEKVVLLIGHAALEKADHLKIRKFARHHKIGVVTDLKARGIIPETDKESLGFIGFNSDLRALEVFDIHSPFAADIVLTIGVRKELIAQYIDDSMVVKHLDPVLFNNWMAAFTEEKKFIKRRVKWLESLNKITPPRSVPVNYPGKVSYTKLFETINRIMPKNTIYCLDSGQIRRAGSIFLTCHFPRSLIQSDILSPMGSGICASVGAQLAAPEIPVVSLFGDGSMRMHGMELATAVKYKLPVIFVLCDNQSYASVKAQKEAKELPEINWGSFAELIGIKSFFVDNQKEFSKQLINALACNEPTLIWTKVNGLLDEEMVKTQTLEYKNWLSGI